MNRLAGCVIQRATMTFCWLPPDSVDISSRSVRQTMPRSAMRSRAMFRSALRRDTPSREMRLRKGRLMFS